MIRVFSNQITHLCHQSQLSLVLEENIGNNLLDICLSDDFLDMTPKAKEIKAKIN